MVRVQGRVRRTRSAKAKAGFGVDCPSQARKVVQVCESLLASLATGWRVLPWSNEAAARDACVRGALPLLKSKPALRCVWEKDATVHGSLLGASQQFKSTLQEMVQTATSHRLQLPETLLQTEASSEQAQSRFDYQPD